MFSFDMIQCGFIVLCLMVVGEICSRRMKASVPAILVSALLYVALLWSGILPSTLIKDSGLTHLTAIAMMFMIIHMGASTKPKELLDNWKVVVLAAITYVGQTALMILVISLLFSKNIALGSLPGGSAVALIVQERANALGYDEIVILSVMILALQSLIACPLASWMVRKEIFRYQTTNQDKKEKELAAHLEKVQEEEEESPYWALLRMFAVAWIASRLEMICGISRYVFCLILGVALAKVGFLHRDEMERSKSRGFIMLMMMTMVLNGFSAATPALIIQLLKPLVCVFAVEVLSIFLISRMVGKKLGFSKEMSFAICLNVMIGFPTNLLLSQEVINVYARTAEEKEQLHLKVATKMVIGGFTSVTFLSTVMAGILVQFMS